MQFVRHRVNAIADLSTVLPEWGCEIDLRSDVGRHGAMHLSHDAWRRGDDFEQWLEAYVAHGIRGPLILNTKEDGLEERADAMVRAAGIADYFFLDTTVPTLVRLSAAGWGERLCVRVSSVEPPSAALALDVRWAWIDCFGGIPLAVDAVGELKTKFKLCLVSPELQGRPLSEIAAFEPLSRRMDAICTKNPNAWTAMESAASPVNSAGS